MKSSQEHEKYIAQIACRIQYLAFFLFVFKGGKKYFNVGTRPNQCNHRYVVDLRMGIYFSDNGFQPICLFVRRAAYPLSNHLDENFDTWSMLEINLNRNKSNGIRADDVDRVISMDSNGYAQMDYTLNDLIDGYVQAVMATYAFDCIAQQLIKVDNGNFDMELFRKLNNHQILLDEIHQRQPELL